MKLGHTRILPCVLLPLLLVSACANGDDPCDPNPCTTPPADFCQDGKAYIYPSVGGCRDLAAVADCTYVPAETDCEAAGLICHGGQCVADPCDPNPCTSPPADDCDVNIAVKYATTGTCDATDAEPTCTYPEVARLDCTQNGRICDAGECVVPPDPCAPNPCDDPPADTCDVNTAIQYGAVGTCSNNGGQAECDYQATSVDCTLDDQVCQLGTCVVPADPCSPNPCNDPPADTCQPGNVARQYNAIGDCTDNGGQAQCDYSYLDIDCDLSSEVCDTGACVPDADPCTPNPCTAPPADDCAAAGEVANHYPNPGSCTPNGANAVCTYTPTTENCATAGDVCQDGACVTPVDPCTPNPCTTPPADTCNVNVAQVHANPGTCTDNGGQAQCAYPVTPVDCAAQGGTCSGGQCILPCSCSGGGLFFSEYVEGTANNKYLEIYNCTGAAVALDGYQIRTYHSTSTTNPSYTIALDAVSLPACGTWVVANPSGAIYTDWDQSSSSMLFNGNDAIELVNPSLARLDVIGTIGSQADYAKDTTLVRNAGIHTGQTGLSYVAGEWTTLAVDTDQLGSHTP